MRKTVIKFLVFIGLLIGVVGVTACDKKDDSNTINDGTINNSNGKNNLNSNEYVLYTDSNPIENDKVKIVAEKPYCSGNENYSLTVRFTVTNKEYMTKSFEFKEMKVIKESTGAQYTAGGYFVFSDKIEIEAELNKSYTIASTIPSSINTDKYKLTFNINDYKITYYFYETPDDLREDRKVTYYVASEQVKTTTVKDGRAITDNYVYESSDYMYYCNEWYLDSKFQTRLTSTTIIKEDTKLYGRKSSCFNFMTSSTDAFSMLNSVNHVPSNKILVIPEKYLNKEICIGNYAIRNIGVEKIYIPKTVHKIYTGNFTGLGNATIYYEGTEEEWKSLFYFASDIVTTRVVYNTKYSN